MQSSRSVEQIILAQSEALREKIKEAKAHEEKRLAYISKANPNRKLELENRYRVERLRDQECIAQLLYDYEQLKTKASNGELKERQKFSAAPEIKTMHLDRFNSFVNVMDVNHKKEIYNSFQNHDIAANVAGINTVYDERVEKKKVMLLF